MRCVSLLSLLLVLASLHRPQSTVATVLDYDGDVILRSPHAIPPYRNIFRSHSHQVRFARMINGDPRCPGTGGDVRPATTRLVPNRIPRPALQMLQHLYVALAPPAISGPSMNREWHQVYQGLQRHPFVNLTILSTRATLQDVQRFDWLVLLTPFHVSLVNGSWIDPSMTRRTIVIDFKDNRVCSHRNPWYDVPPYRALVYFKRAYVRRAVGVSTAVARLCPLNVAPMHYAIFDHWLPRHTIPWEARPYAVVCTLRARLLHTSTSSAGRWNAVQWLKEFQAKTSYRMLIKSVSHFGDQCIDMDYIRTLHRAKVIVTCQPAHWETDFRTWESLASGALVFVDRMLTPLAHPPQDRVHWILFDPFNKTEFHQKLLYYLTHQAEARAVAQAGYLHAMRHHRTVSRMDHVLWTALANKSRTMDLGPLTVKRRRIKAVEPTSA